MVALGCFPWLVADGMDQILLCPHFPDHVFAGWSAPAPWRVSPKGAAKVEDCEQEGAAGGLHKSGPAPDFS
jgi:hypothetical protein